MTNPCWVRFYVEVCYNPVGYSESQEIEPSNDTTPTRGKAGVMK